MMTMRPNTPLEWTGPRQLSAALPQAPCLPLRGSVMWIEPSGEMLSGCHDDNSFLIAQYSRGI